MLRRMRIALFLLAACNTSMPARDPNWQGDPSGTNGDADVGGDTMPAWGDDNLAGCNTQCLVTRALDGCHTFFASFCGYIYRCYSGQDLSDIESSGGFNDEPSCET